MCYVRPSGLRLTKLGVNPNRKARPPEGASAGTSVCVPVAQLPASESEYHEVQQGAWCGKHALNNLMGGSYVDCDACHLAAQLVVLQLSEFRGDQEIEEEHFHATTGWLSVQLMNVLGAANLGIHEEDPPEPGVSLRRLPRKQVCIYAMNGSPSPRRQPLAMYASSTQSAPPQHHHRRTPAPTAPLPKLRGPALPHASSSSIAAHSFVPLAPRRQCMHRRRNPHRPNTTTEEPRRPHTQPSTRRVFKNVSGRAGKQF